MRFWYQNSRLITFLKFHSPAGLLSKTGEQEIRGTQISRYPAFKDFAMATLPSQDQTVQFCFAQRTLSVLVLRSSMFPYDLRILFLLSASHNKDSSSFFFYQQHGLSVSDKLYISHPKFTFDLCMKEAIIMKPTRVNNAHKKDLSPNSQMFHVNKVYKYEINNCFYSNNKFF